MASTFEQLAECLVLSGSPVGTGTAEQWADLHRRLGRRLPIDYCQFVSRYGSCAIDNYLVIINPFERAGRGFWDRLDQERATPRSAIRPNHFFCRPRPKGMIPWAETDDGGACFWVTDDPDPDRWTVYEEWDLYGVRFSGGMEDYLLAALLRRSEALAVSGAFPSTMPAHVDPIVELVNVGVVFEESSHSVAEVRAAVRAVFPSAAPQGGRAEHYLIVRPQGWTVVYEELPWPRLQLGVPPADLPAAKAAVVRLARALGVAVSQASEPAWADIVGR